MLNYERKVNYAHDEGQVEEETEEIEVAFDRLIIFALLGKLLKR